MISERFILYNNITNFTKLWKGWIDCNVRMIWNYTHAYSRSDVIKLLGLHEQTSVNEIFTNVNDVPMSIFCVCTHIHNTVFVYLNTVCVHTYDIRLRQIWPFSSWKIIDSYSHRKGSIDNYEHGNPFSRFINYFTAVMHSSENT